MMKSFLMSKHKLTTQRFVIDVDELSRQNALKVLVLSGSSKIEFILTFAVKAYFADDQNPSYVPNALTYYKKMCSESLSHLQLHHFFVYLERDIKETVQTLSRTAQSARTSDDDLVHAVGQACSAVSLSMFKRLIYFTLFTNEVDMSECSCSWYTQAPTKTYTIFTVKSTTEKETSFHAAKDSSKFMFYCAKEENVYSVCRKGASFVCDCVDIKTYGQGVYLTEQFISAMEFTHAHCATTTTDRVVLCYEVKNYLDKNVLYNNGKRRATQMYVMAEEDICLRAILWFREGSAELMGHTVASNLLQSLHQEMKTKVAGNTSSASASAAAHPAKAAPAAAPVSTTTTATASTASAARAPTPTSAGRTAAATAAPHQSPPHLFTAPRNSPKLTVAYPTYEPKGHANNATKKRVLMELQELQTNPPVGVIHRANNLVDGKPESPLLVEMNIPAGTKLHKQGAKLGISTIVFACYFPQDYPFTAVQIRVVRPRIRRHTGHVTFGGSVCADMLYVNGWSPNNTLMGSLMSCLFLISDDSIPGYGQIEQTTLGQEYTYEEFTSSYSFTANVHRWKM